MNIWIVSGRQRAIKSHKEPDNTLEALLEFAEIDKDAKIGSLSVGGRSRLLLTGVLFLRAENYVLCGLYEGVTTADADILDKILTELSLSGNLHIGYMEEPPTGICDEIVYL